MIHIHGHATRRCSCSLLAGISVVIIHMMLKTHLLILYHVHVCTSGCALVPAFCTRRLVLTLQGTHSASYSTVGEWVTHD